MRSNNNWGIKALNISFIIGCLFLLSVFIMALSRAGRDDGATSSSAQASEAQSFDKYVIGEELPGEIVAWRGYSGAFVLQDVKLGDGRIVVAASKIRVNQDVHQKVYVAESVWQDRKSGESFFILTRYRQ